MCIFVAFRWCEWILLLKDITKYHIYIYIVIVYLGPGLHLFGCREGMSRLPVMKATDTLHILQTASESEVCIFLYMQNNVSLVCSTSWPTWSVETCDVLPAWNLRTWSACTVLRARLRSTSPIFLPARRRRVAGAGSRNSSFKAMTIACYIPIGLQVPPFCFGGWGGLATFWGCGWSHKV